MDREDKMMANITISFIFGILCLMTQQWGYAILSVFLLIGNFLAFGRC